MYQIAFKLYNATRFINKERIGKMTLSHVMYESTGARQATVNDRTDCPVDTLPLHCVANAIAVLSGDRPIPAKRFTTELVKYPQYSKYVEIAKRARIRIDTPLQFEVTSKAGEKFLIENTSVKQTVKASMYNLATDKGVSVKQRKTTATMKIDGVDYPLIRGCPTHESIGTAWPRETYLAFDSMCCSVLGADYKSRLSVPETLSKLRDLYVGKDSKVSAFFDCLGTVKGIVNTDLVMPVVQGVVSGSIFRGEQWANQCELKSWGAQVSVHGSPEPTWVINGMIYLQLTAEEAEAILAGPETATMLDEGLLSPVDPKTETDGFASLREVVCEWDDGLEKYPVPFAG